MEHTEHTHNTSIDTPQQDNAPTGNTTLRRVWQDKGAEYRATIGTSQPAPDKKHIRARQSDTKTARAQNKYTNHQKTEKVTIWLKPVMKRELEHIAASEHLSISATGGAFLEKAIQSDIHAQHGALLETVIEKAIHTSMREYSNRLALLLVRVAFASEQTRALITNVLARQPGVTPELLKAILDGSSNTAKRNISRRTPQLEAMIQELDALLSQESEG